MGARSGGRTVEGAASAIDCPHAPDCVGCPYIGVRYGEQLRRKRERVEQALAAYPALSSLAVAKPVGSQRVFGYRNQVKLVAREAKRGLLLGVYKPGSHQVVDVSRCPVHDSLVANALAQVRRAVERTATPIYDERSRQGWLRYVAVRSSWTRRTTQVTLVVRDRGWSGESALVERLRRSRGIGSVVLNVNATTGNAVFGDVFVPRTRHDALVERVGGVHLKFRAGSFVQANLGAARRAYERVAALAALAPGEVAVDLFCGVGAISLLLATSGATVFGIESSESAVRDAVENTRVNGLHNVRFRAAGAAQGLDTLARELDRIDVVTLNPPRKGAGRETLRAIAAVAPSRIVYMSCDPESLARDLADLAELGYAAQPVEPFDFLPQTEHIESVVRLDRADPVPEKVEANVG